MGRVKKSIIEKRQRDFATYVAQMKTGHYDWPDGKDHIDNDGCFQIGWYEAYERAGYDHDNSRTLGALRKNQEVLDMIALEETRLKSRSLARATANASAFGRIKEAAANELMARLEANPWQFRNNELIKIYTSMERMERIADANAPAQISGGTTINVANLNLDLKDKLPEGNFQELIETSIAEKSKQISDMETLLSAVRAKESEIIDGEAEECTSDTQH